MFCVHSHTHYSQATSEISFAKNLSQLACALLFAVVDRDEFVEWVVECLAIIEHSIAINA